MAVSLDQFSKAVVTAGLMTAEEIKTLWSAIPAAERPKEAASLGKLLVDRGKLTPFQATVLGEGRSTLLNLGDYTVLAEIGAGGMGQVYKARHRRMERVVALKVMSAAAMKDEAAVKRFQREVRAAARLEHPNIVTAYDSGEAGSVKYLVMQFVDGGDLSSLVKKNGPLPVEQAVDYVLQAARGLGFAHGEGVIHRDIKPANLLLDKKGVVKILDMGLARIESSDDGLTATEQVMGTVDYMSPEQATNTKGVDARADIYSLGCTLWYLLTGKKAYEGDTMIQRLMAHKDAPLPSLVKVRDDVPWPLEQAFHKMVAKRAEDRFQSMDEVVAALAPFGGGATSSTGMGSSIGHGSGPQNAELSAFLKTVGPGPKTQAKPAASSTHAAVEATAQLVKAEAETDPKSEVRSPPNRAAAAAKPQAKGSGGKKPPANKNLMLAAAGGGALLVLLGVWFIFRGPNGEELARIQLPDGGSVTVSTASPAGTAAVRPTPSGTTAPRTTPDFFTAIGASSAAPPPGDYALTLENADTGLGLDFSKPFTLEAYITPRGEDNLVQAALTCPSILNLNGGKEWTFHLISVAKVGSGVAPVVGKRTHVAGVYTPQSLQIFVDGVLRQTTKLTGFALPSQAPLHLGYQFSDRIDEVRVSKSARYAQNFTPAARHEPDADTLLLYHCDEGVGNLLRDASGHGRDALIRGARWTKADGSPVPPPAVAAGVPSNLAPGETALEFDGVDDYVSLPSLTYDGQTSATFEAWITPHALSGNQSSGAQLNFAQDWMGNAQSAGLDLMMLRYGKWAIMFHDAGNSNSAAGYVTADADDPATLYQRYHIAGIVDLERRALRLYVDGVQQQDIVPLRGQHKSSTFPFLLGADPSPDAPGFHFPSHGRMHGVRISRGVRYTQNFTPAKTWTPDADTLALYAFNEGSGDVLRDLSGNKHDGKIVGATWVRGGATPAPPPATFPFATATPTRWPLAPSKVADIQWLVGLGADVTLRTALPSVNSSIDQTIKTATEIPAGPATIVGVQFREHAVRLTDADLARICGFIDLESLGFAEAGGKKNGAHEITGQGWSKIAALKHLRSLRLGDCRPVTVLPDFMASLTALELLDLQYMDANEWARAAAAAPVLKQISAYRTLLDDEGLVHLEKRTSLLEIDLRSARATQTGIDRFAAAVPQCRIKYGTEDKNPTVIEPRVPPPSAANPAAAPPPGDYALELRGFDNKPADGGSAWVDVPSLLLSETGPLTLEARVASVGHNEGLVLGTDDLRLRLSAAQWTTDPGRIQPTPIEGKRWYHLALVRNDAEIRMYVDGKRTGKLLLSARTGPQPPPKTLPLKIGGNNAHLRLDEIRISGTARYDKDFTPPTKHVSDADTLALYHCDDGAGDVLKDASGNGHDGKITKPSWVLPDGSPIPVGSMFTAPAATPGGVVYLDDLPEIEAIVGYSSLGKHGKYEDKDKGGLSVLWRGGPVAHSLFMHPGPGQTSLVRYQIDGRYTTFAADAGISETGQSASLVTFRVLGDGRELWKSQPVLQRGESAAVSVDIRGVKELRLETSLQGNANGCHATWFMPRLTPVAPTAPVAAPPAAAGVVYLDDLPEIEAIVGYMTLHKHGTTKGQRALSWRGSPVAHSLWMRPKTNHVSFVRYRLDGQYARFEADTGQTPETGSPPSSPMTFRVLGDGRELWKSKPIAAKDDFDVVSVDVRGVQELRLETTCAGAEHLCEATWYYPRLTPVAAVSATPSPGANTAGTAPPAAVFPFDAATALKHQEAWATHLGVPVEFTNTVGMKFRLIPPGEFQMGLGPEFTDEELIRLTGVTGVQDIKKLLLARSAHPVRITRPFYMQVEEVTSGWYRDVVGQLRPEMEPDPNKVLSGWVAWPDAIAFCNRLSEREGKRPAYRIEGTQITPLDDADGYRLPTEAQWEYACRAGTNTLWYFGNEGSADGRTFKNQAAAPNPFGLTGLYGGSNETCWDAGDDRPYSDAMPTRRDDPRQDEGTRRIKRGGSNSDGGGAARQSVNSFVRATSPADPYGSEPMNYSGFGRVVLPIAAAASIPSDPRTSVSGPAANPSLTVGALPEKNAAPRWPLAPTKPEDVQWLLAKNCVVTVRGPSAFGGDAMETSLKPGDAIPSGSQTVVGLEWTSRNEDFATDDDLARIATFVDLEQLNFNDAAMSRQITSAGMLKLASLVNLRRLDVHQCKDKADGAESILQVMPQLEYLRLPFGRNVSSHWAAAAVARPSLRTINVFRSDFGDAGLIHFEKMPQLLELDLSDNSALTEAAVEKLAAAKSNCRIVATFNGERRVFEPRTPPPPSEPRTSVSGPAAPRWPLAPSKPEDIVWLQSLNATFTLRGPSAFSDDPSDVVVKPKDPLPTKPATIVGLDFGRDNFALITDDVLKRTAKLVDLENLMLGFASQTPAVTKDGLPQLATLVQLRRLNLTRIGPRETDPAFLERFVNLESLSLGSQPFLDWEPHVARLPRLAELRLDKMGAANLQRLGPLPRLKELGLSDYGAAEGSKRHQAAKQYAPLVPWCRITIFGQGNADPRVVIEPTAPPPAD